MIGAGLEPFDYLLLAVVGGSALFAVAFAFAILRLVWRAGNKYEN